MKICEGEHVDEGIGPCALLAPCAGRNGLVQTSDLIGKSLSFEPRSAAASGQCARWLESNYLVIVINEKDWANKSVFVMSGQIILILFETAVQRLSDLKQRNRSEVISHLSLVSTKSKETLRIT